jgi:hypothetical protein
LEAPNRKTGPPLFPPPQPELHKVRRRNASTLTRRSRNQKGTSARTANAPRSTVIDVFPSTVHPELSAQFEQAAGSLQRLLRVQAVCLTRAGKPLGNQDLSRRSSREYRSAADHSRELKQSSGNIFESTRAARRFPEDARTVRRSYSQRLYRSNAARFSPHESRTVCELPCAARCSGRLRFFLLLRGPPRPGHADAGERPN